MRPSRHMCWWSGLCFSASGVGLCLDTVVYENKSNSVHCILLPNERLTKATSWPQSESTKTPNFKKLFTRLDNSKSTAAIPNQRKSPAEQNRQCTRSRLMPQASMQSRSVYEMSQGNWNVQKICQQMYV